MIDLVHRVSSPRLCHPNCNSRLLSHNQRDVPPLSIAHNAALDTRSPSLRGAIGHVPVVVALVELPGRDNETDATVDSISLCTARD